MPPLSCWCPPSEAGSVQSPFSPQPQSLGVCERRQPEHLSCGELLKAGLVLWADAGRLCDVGGDSLSDAGLGEGGGVAIAACHGEGLWGGASWGLLNRADASLSTNGDSGTVVPTLVCQSFAMS